MSVPLSPAIAVPATLDAALAPEWLSAALGREVAAVETVEVIRTVATKVRFVAQFADGARGAYCLKGLLDVDAMTARGGPTCVLEADFYGRIAERLAVRVPACIATVIDRERQQAVVIMRDLVVDGARFCSALDPFSADDAGQSLAQLAALHQGSALLDDAGWIRPRAADLAKMTYISVETLQELLDGPRGEGLPGDVRDAGRLVAAMRALAERDAARPQFLIHGDSHAGNVFRTRDGPGLIDWQLLQRGGWALDVAYHLCAVLPADVAAREERRLLGDYLARMRAAGMAMPDDEAAWAQYREAVLYGFYLWSITRRVEPPVIVAFVQRLGAGVVRHASHRLLGVT